MNEYKHLRSTLSMPRDTTTGRVLEQMIHPALIRGGYQFREQVTIGQKMSGRKHRVDALIDHADGAMLVSLKWQQTSGTAEEKIPFEIINLMDACQRGPYRKAYLVLGGIDSIPGSKQGGWTLRQWYLSGELKQFLNYHPLVEILLPDEFVAKANAGLL